MATQYQYSAEEISEMYAVSIEEVYAAREIRKRGIPELVGELQKGHLTLDQALQLLKHDVHAQRRMLSELIVRTG